MLFKLLRQIITLSITATLFGLALTYLKVPLIIGIPLGVLIQFGLYYAFITSLNAYMAIKDKQIENERIKEFSLQGLEVTCPCSLKKVEFVPITLNTNNAYKCNTCQKNVSVYVVPETALMTEPVISQQVPNMIPSITE